LPPEAETKRFFKTPLGSPGGVFFVAAVFNRQASVA
jgi:hypothetical protein